VRNLGHKATDASLTKNPAGRVMNYDTAPQGERQIKEGQRLTTGVYGRHVPIKSGISSADNLRVWSKYSTSNSYTSRGNKAGLGKDPPQSDDSRQHVPAAGKASDGYLADPREWSRFDRGSESGEGRLEKIHRK
jgi:hypothetical protein